jgi:peptidoglycan hydrolase-like amidase
MANKNYDANSETFDTSQYEEEAKSKEKSNKKSGGFIGGEAKKGDIKLKVQQVKTKIIIALIIGIPILLLAIFIVLFYDESLTDGSSNAASSGYYRITCKEITVLDVDTEGNITGSNTYSLNDYVSGVVAAEVASLTHIELYKAFSLAARTYVLSHQNDCSIENSDRFQVFRDISNDNSAIATMIHQAVEETDNLVLLQDNKLFSTEYDSFCFIEKDENYYTLSQQNQKIPTDWVNATVRSVKARTCPCELRDESMTECWDNGKWTDGGHGRGMGQYGAYYLAQEGYTYDEILKFYYGDDVTISKKGYMGNIPNLELKLTGDGEILEGTRLADFLDENGDSIENLNAYIHDNVEEVGVGTREGVVMAAVSLINYMYDGYHKKLPYWFGGVYQQIGASPNWGGVRNPDYYGYIYDGFDCAAFASWTVINGGFNFTKHNTAGFGELFNKNSCLLMDDDCIGQPGDFINSRYGHIELILAVDEEAGIYWLAHSGSESSGIYIKTEPLHRSRNSGSSTAQEPRILFMEDFYSNPANVNQNY